MTPISALSEENCYMFLKTYIGMNFQNVSSETLKEIEMSEYYKDMPTYPSSGSMQIVNDICIVKMSETR